MQITQVQDQRQQMTLAPHLRQSLEFLQAPMFELRSQIREEIERNPTLEEMNDRHEPLEEEESSPTDAGLPEGDLEFKDKYDALLRLDDEWREYFQQAAVAQPYTREDAERRRFVIESVTQPVYLQDHLMGQIGMAGLDDRTRALVTLLIGSLNDDGYLIVTLGELAETTGASVDALEAALRELQQMDPVGVGARDLRECLLLQLERLGAEQETAARIVRDHLDALGERRHAEIAKSLGIPVEEVYRAARLLATLEPRPGRAFGSEQVAPVTPEVVVQKVGGDYVVQLNDEWIPRLRISRTYRQMLENPDLAADAQAYIREKIRAGANLIRSVGQRQQTILKIAREIVRVQAGFLEHGLSHLKPLVMSEIARIVGVHETTVSRAVSQKYMQTHRGLFELKYFFTPGFRAQDGSEVSNRSIMDRIENMVAQEDLAHPLSDQVIAERLRAEGLNVARRTVAKYRKSLHIPSSSERRGRRS